jgi:uncharacterized membrane protein (UPF0127 family)
VKNLTALALCALLLTNISVSCATAITPTAPDVNTISANTAVTIRNIITRVEIADTPDEHTQGLSTRDSLEEGWGMLFVFDEPEMPIFWMKDMRFPIDILWISPENRLSGIIHAAQPEPNSREVELNLYRPPGLVSYVLELKADTAKRNNFAIGDMVEITGVTSEN